MIQISKQYESAFKLKNNVVYIAALCDKKQYSNDFEDWYTISIEDYNHCEIMELYNELKNLFNDCEFTFSNYSVQYYSIKRKLFKQWMQSDNVIKLGNKYTFQCIQYKKQFTYKQSYKYWLKEYYCI